MPGPDFPTGGVILGRGGIRNAYHTGRGSIMMRGKVEMETVRKEREAIVITEIPFQVNKATMVERIAELVREKKIEGVADLRDESNREGYRVVVELKREAIPDVVLNQLYRYTPLQTSFGANMVALDGGRPLVMNLKDLLTSFLAFREEVVSRRTKFLLNKARDRAHVLVGLAIAVANIDEIIRLIRASKDANEAREALVSRDWPARAVEAMITLIDDPRHRINADGTYKLSDTQARAILDLRLQRLTALGVEEIQAELDKLAAEISDYLDILRSRARIQTIVKDELAKVKADFATPRRTEIVEQMDEVEEEDLIHREDMVVTVSHQGYIKRVPLSTYRAQRRGGKGRAGMQTREEDFVARLFVASTHAPVLYFSSLGRVYKLKVWKLPVAAPQARGKALINILPLAAGRAHHHHHAAARGRDDLGQARRDVRDHQGHGAAQQAVGFLRRPAVRHHRDEACRGRGHRRRADLHREGRRAADRRATASASALRCRMCACSPGARRWACAAFRWTRATGSSRCRSCGMSMRRAEERAAYLKRANAVRRGDEARCRRSTRRRMPRRRTADTIELGEKRYVEMSALEQFVLTISEKGMGKRTSSYEYRITNRGGKGIVAMGILEGKKGAKTIRKKTGKLVASFPVEESDQIMLVTDGGQLIRTRVEGVRIVSRSSQGVIVFDTAEDERVVSVERLSEEGDDVSNGS